MKKILYILLFVLVSTSVYSATYWVDDPANCPSTDASNFPGQDCSPDEICGDSSGIAQCYDTDTLVPPSFNSTSITNWASAYNGGYVVNCEATADASSPFCDNSGNFWCDRNSTCYSTNNRNTICIEDTWATSDCGDCRSGYLDCDTDSYSCEIQVGGSCGFSTGTYESSCLTVGSGGVGDCTSTTRLDCNNDDSDADPTTCNGGSDGCEILIGGSCTVGGLPGTYSGVCSGSSGTCVVDKSYFETGTLAEYSTDSDESAMLWFKNYNVIGWLINATNFYNQTWGVNNDSCMVLRDGTEVCDGSDLGGADTIWDISTSQWLYNNSGVLDWNETKGNLYFNQTQQVNDVNSSLQTLDARESANNATQASLISDNTNLINAVNTTANIEGLGFTTGAHTVDTNETDRVNSLNSTLVTHTGDSTIHYTQASISITESQISDLSHTTDTNANTICSGTNVYLDGEGNCDTVVSATVDGSGATNYVAYWTDSDTLSYDSGQLYWDATNNKLGIGNSNPNDYYSVFSDLVVGTTSGETGITIASGTTNKGDLVFADATSGTGEYAGMIYYDHSGNDMYFTTNGDGYAEGGDEVVITDAGYVGIGTITPGMELDVEGSARIGTQSPDDGNGKLVVSGDSTGQSYTDDWQFALVDQSDNSAFMYMGVDASPLEGFIQVVDSEGAWGDLILQPNGQDVELGEDLYIPSGEIGIGTTPTGAPITISDTVSGGGGVYRGINMDLVGSATGVDRWGMDIDIDMTGSTTGGDATGVYVDIDTTSTSAIAVGFKTDVDNIGTGTNNVFAFDGDVGSQNNASDAYGVSITTTDTPDDTFILYGNSASAAVGTEWGLYLTGEDYNYMAGDVLIGATTAKGFDLEVHRTSNPSIHLESISTSYSTPDFNMENNFNTFEIQNAYYPSSGGSQVNFVNSASGAGFHFKETASATDIGSWLAYFQGDVKITGDLDVDGYVCGHTFFDTFSNSWSDSDTGNEQASSFTSIETDGKTITCVDCEYYTGAATTCATDTNTWVKCEFVVTC